MRSIAPVLPALLLTGCGLAMNGAYQTVFINSEPQSAEVRTGPAELQYWTPATMELARKHEYQLTFELAGYAPVTVPLKHHVQAGVVVLDLIGTLGVGLIPDAISGAWYRLEPGSPMVTLIANPPVMAGMPERVSVTLRGEANGTVSAESTQPGVRIHVAVIRLSD